MCGAPATTTIPSATSTGVFAGGTFTCPASGAQELAVKALSLALVSLYALYWEDTHINRLKLNMRK